MWIHQVGRTGHALSPAVEAFRNVRSLNSGCGRPSGQDKRIAMLCPPGGPPPTSNTQAWWTRPLPDPTRAASAAADPRCCFCGYYASTTFGDYALLEALLGKLPAGIVPVVTAFDQLRSSAASQLETPQRRQCGVLEALGSCRALVARRGSLLQDSTSFRSLLYYAALILAARLRTKTVLLWAQGLGP